MNDQKLDIIIRLIKEGSGEAGAELLTVIARPRMFDMKRSPPLSKAVQRLVA